MATKSPHDQHRQRMRDRAASQGMQGFADYELLEMLLYQAVPRGDTNALAHRLLAHFGCYHRVFEATEEELRSVEGVGERVAFFLHALGEHERRCAVDRAAFALHSVALNTPTRIEEFVCPQFTGLRQERVLLVTLDSRARPISCAFLTQGVADTAVIEPRRVVEIALRDQATAVLLAHNHPRGSAIPSREDIETTRQLMQTLSSVGLSLYEHLVVGDDACAALLREGWCDRQFDR